MGSILRPRRVSPPGPALFRLRKRGDETALPKQFSHFVLRTCVSRPLGHPRRACRDEKSSSTVRVVEGGGGAPERVDGGRLGVVSSPRGKMDCIALARCTHTRCRPGLVGQRGRGSFPWCNFVSGGARTPGNELCYRKR